MDENQQFLTSENYWIQYIKFDTPLFLLFFVFFGIGWLCRFAIIGSIEIYIEAMFWGSDGLVVIVFLMALYFTKKIPKNLETTILEAKSILIKEHKVFQKKTENFEKYRDYVKGAFTNKKQKILPFLIVLLIAIPLVIMFFINGWNSFTIGDKKIELDTLKSIINILNNIFSLIALIFTGLLAFSAIMQIITTFNCIKKLGSDKFPLHVSYGDLKTGVFEHLGILIISLTIPVILITTTIGIAGMIMVLLFKNYFTGIMLIVGGMLMTILMAYLLYIDTISIHKAISKWKKNLLRKTIKDIQSIINEYEEKKKNDQLIDYERIQIIHDFYNETIDINDWPFNPVSVKKLVVTLGSSILPLLLSLFGFV